LVDGVTVYAVDVLAEPVSIALGHGEKFRFTDKMPPITRKPPSAILDTDRRV